MQMQQQRQQRRQQQSPKAYSPDYSSPMSSQSILQARFDKGSPSRYGPQTKENYPEAPLPIFQDTNTQMIPHVTIGDSDTGGGHVLSDMSDEQLIKQLQLQINSDKQAAALMSSSNTMFESASQIAASRECSTNQPFQERAVNINQSPTKDLINICQVSNQVKLQEKPKQPKKKSMQNHSKFVNSKVQTHTWQRPQSSPQQEQVKSTSARQIKHQRQASKPENALLSNRVDQNNRFQQKQVANPPVTHRDRLVFDSVEDHENPIPRPYPMQQFVRSEITDTFEQTQTITTNQKETSPAISQEDKFKNYVETDSSKKLEQYMAWSSPSPAQKVAQKAQHNQDVLDVIQVHQFAQNSTIPEQPTEEQLQASGTVTMINYNNRHGSNNASGVQQRQQRSTESLCKSNSQKPGLESVQEPQIMMPSQIQANAQDEGDTNNGLDSESMEQIRMINQAMQTNFPTNFSPDRDDVSDSLKDFSVGCEPRQNGIAVSNEFYQAAPLVDFGNYTKAATNQGSMINQSHTSLVNHKDSLSTCQNAKQLAMTYFINANMHPETVQGENRLPKGQGQGADSTLLHPEKSLGSANGALKQFLIEQTTKQTNSNSRVGSGHVSRNSQQKSPIRQRSTLIYGQCQAPSEELYKPILRNTERASGKKRANEAQQNKQLSQSVKGLPAKLDFGAYTGRQVENAMRQSANTTSVPNFISPSTTQVGSTRSRGDSKVSIRRNLENQLNSSKNSLSPVMRQASPINSSSGYNKNQLNTMLQKFGINTRKDASKKSTTVNHSRATSGRMDTNNGKKSPSPVLLHRTRNDNVQVTKSFNVASQQQQQQQQNTTKTDFTAFAALQTSQRNLQRKQAHQQNSGSSKFQNTSSRPSVKSAQRSTTPKSKSPVTRTIMTHQSRNTLLCSNPNQVEQMTQTFRAKPTTQLRASIYQLRRATESMKWLEIQMFLDLERIKKPSAAVLAISRMSCIFFEALRNRDPIIMDQVEGMQSWSQIQEYMRMQLTCCVPELRTLLKQKVVTLGRLNDETPREMDILRSLETIWETFFTESKIRVIRRFIQTSKLMRGLVHLIYSFVCLALNLEREFNYENLLGLTEQPQIRFDEVKVIYASALSLAPATPHQNQIVQKPQSSQKLLLSQQSKSRSREDLQQSLEINNIEIDQNNQSSCSKCSCHLRQSMTNNNQTKSSFASKAASGKRSAMSRKSQERSRSPEQYQQVQMEMHVFRTLEQAYMEQLSLNSQQVKSSNPQNNNSLSAKYMYQQAEVPKRQRSGSSKRSPSKQSQKHMNYNNYTSVQLPKPYQAKPRTQTPEDLCNVMTIMDQYQAESSRNHIQERITSPTNHNRAGSKPSLTSRPVNRQGSARPSFQKTSAPQQDKDTKDAMRRKRKSTVSNGSDFVSVVRASAAASMTPSQNLTPKASNAQQKSGTIVSVAHRNAGAATQRQTRKSQNQPLSQNKYQAVPVKREEKPKRDVSPVTPTSQKRPAPQKVPCSKIMANSVSQNRLMTGSNQVSRNVHNNNAQSHGGKHSRTSTLYKSTASASAKQKTAQPPQQTTTSRTSMMQRDASSKSIWTKQQQVFAVQAVMASQQAPQKQLSRKTKSQANLKLSQQTKRSTTPKEQKNAFSDMLKQQKRQMAQRNIDHLRVVSQQDLDDFIAVEQTLQLENAPTIESLKPTDSIPSFGGLNILQTEVLQNNNYMQDTIEEEESSQRLVTKRTATAPVVQASFTPQKIQTFMEVPDSSANPKTPYLQGMMTGTIQMSSPAYKQAQHGEVLFTNDSLEEPSCAIDCQMPNEQRTHFIMEKAQAITENINSCYKSHNMPKIDMATIQQLKMRRMQFMQKACSKNDQEREADDVPKMRRSADPTTSSSTTTNPLQQQKTRNKLRNNMPVTMQSCNVMTTMTVEMCDTVSDAEETESPECDQRDELEDVSFTEALNKLKAEVACLMQQRTKTNQPRYQ